MIMARQWDGAEYAWQANRPSRCRTPVPAIGDRLLFRPAAWSPDLLPIVVIEVQDMDSDEAKTDPNVFDKVTNPEHTKVLTDPRGRPLTRLRDDPWPIVYYRHLDADGEPIGAPGSCREARIEGAAGWLPLDHADRERPHWDGGRLVIPQ